MNSPLKLRMLDESPGNHFLIAQVIIRKKSGARHWHQGHWLEANSDSRRLGPTTNGFPRLESLSNIVTYDNTSTAK